MNKEQFLAMSLPHGVKIMGNEKLDVVGLMNGRIWFSDRSFLPLMNVHCIPILHPLSDLTKEIEHKGEKFVPIYKINNFELESKTTIYPTLIGICDRSIYDDLTTTGGGSWEGGIEDDIDTFQFFELYLKLVEWHFDICGLIEKGDAIDVNSLSKNPYK